MDDRRALQAWAEDLMAAPKSVLATLEWRSGPNGSRQLEAQVVVDDEAEDHDLALHAHVNRFGEWSIHLTANGSIQLLRGCSKGGHATPGYHGLRHPQLNPGGTPHESDPGLEGLTAEQALQQFCRRTNIRFTAEQMDFGRDLDGS